MKNWLTQTTGDPFADIGGLVIEYFQEKEPDRSIEQLIQWVTEIYVKKWNNNLHSFFLNSTITHNSNKGQKGIDKTIQYFQNLLAGVNGHIGYCRITGQKTTVFTAARDNHIMSGSSTLINFHHGFESGIQLSKEALIRIFFVPLGVEQLGDKVAALVSNDESVTRYFVQKNIEQNLQALGMNMSEAINKSEFSNPTNALFDYATRCIAHATIAISAENTFDNLTLNLFHFTNFGASPAISIISLPARVFAFYAYCITRHQKDWQNFIFRQYASSKFKNAQYNSADQTWSNSKEQADFQTYKTWRNKIYEALLSDNTQAVRKAILYHTRDFHMNFQIVEQFQINIRNMDKRTLAKIKELADFIISDSSDDEITKSLTTINKQRSGNGLRRYLVGLVVQYNQQHSEKPKPLITVEEYADFLFPDGTYWNEIRDLLVIAIYQKLHELNKKITTELLEDEEAAYN